MTLLVGNLGFQSITDHYETPCSTLSTFKYIYDALGITSDEEDAFRAQPITN